MTLRIMNLENGKLRTVKNFDATENSELKIANALYEGKQKSKLNEKVLITTYYSADYYVFSINNDELEVGNERYYNPEVLVKGINKDLVVKYYNDLLQGIKQAVKLPEAYKFLKSPYNSNLPKKEIHGNRYYNFRVFPCFVKDVLSHPSRYSEKGVDICKLLFTGLSDNEINDIEIAAEMVRFPTNYKPKVISAERIGYNKWTIKCELDGYLVSYNATYDTKGISKFGAICDIELVGNLVKNYLYSYLREDWLLYTNSDISFKVYTTAHLLSDYLYNKRGSDFRSRQGKEKNCLIKSADEFIIDMSEVLNLGRNEDERRLTKDVLYEVINYLKSHEEELSKYEKEDSQNRDFYSWLKGRTSRNQNLFKNVPKE